MTSERISTKTQRFSKERNDSEKNLALIYKTIPYVTRGIYNPHSDRFILKLEREFKHWRQLKLRGLY